ncbi:hypothetical protein PENPOL_c033G07087 [Penicillium polonicum]|uniref:Uncharacterized protein n=1 Tax=Penicillium polonicum TaxID=60169 RepID=A0A1V6N5R3_PENPO|nr:hypothetical protein PENPOL_c033G07087 [Penicillium polonicum]
MAAEGSWKLTTQTVCPRPLPPLPPLRAADRLNLAVHLSTMIATVVPHSWKTVACDDSYRLVFLPDSDNMPAKQARVREVASQALPPLPLGPNHTKSNAIHNIRYVGEIHRWSNFLRFVQTYVQGQRWSNRVIKYTHRLGDPEVESNLIGDETGLQGVFNHSVGFIVGKILKAQSIGLEFADFKCLGNPDANTPDSIMMTTNGQLKVVGELKAPWVEEHKMSEEKKTMLRHLLAQPIK